MTGKCIGELPWGDLRSKEPALSHILSEVEGAAVGG